MTPPRFTTEIFNPFRRPGVYDNVYNLFVCQTETDAQAEQIAVALNANESKPAAGIAGCTVADGKYTIQCDGDGRMRALRYGEPWRDLTGDKLILALAQEIESLRRRCGDKP